MAIVNSPAGTLTYSVEDESGTKGKIEFNFPYATLTAAVIVAADALIPLLAAVTGCAILGYSITYRKIEDTPSNASAGSRVEDKGVFIFTTSQAKTVRYSIPGIVPAAVNGDGSIKTSDAAVAALTAAMVAGGAIFCDSNGADLRALIAAYQAFRKSTGNMLPSDRLQP